MEKKPYFLALGLAGEITGLILVATFLGSEIGELYPAYREQVMGGLIFGALFLWVYRIMKLVKRL